MRGASYLSAILLNGRRNKRALIMSDQSMAVINDNLVIAGQRVKIISQGKLQIDCEFEGDVSGTEVVISARGRVLGTVFAERVIVIGKIRGGIRGKSVALKSSALVEGDIHHTALTIENGATFTGRARELPSGSSSLHS